MSIHTIKTAPFYTARPMHQTECRPLEGGIQRPPQGESPHGTDPTPFGMPMSCALAVG